MTLDLTTILIFTIGALVYSAILPATWRGWALLIASVIAIYWLQPALAIRYMDFALPTATLALTVTIWWFVRQPYPQLEAHKAREDQITFGVMLAIIIGMAAMRFLDADYRLTASRPPEPSMVLLMLALFAIIVLAFWQATRRFNTFNVLSGVIIALIVIFVLLKTEPFAASISRFFRTQTGQDTSLASMVDLGWLGFSYVAFRLIHTLRDKQSGKLGVFSLREYMTYVIFFPSFTAGPIDRIERFVKDYRTLPDKIGLHSQRIIEGGTRIFVGIFKKFVIADTLALGMSLNATNAAQIDSVPWAWLLLYGYAFRLFFDFSGYSDIAIGIAILLGIKLPENFDRPYVKHNLALFWQSWHMTLSNWARFYVFTPLSRVLLTRKPAPSPLVVVFAAQISTMIVIGLWHGVTWNFLIWAVWHGLGLFIHKQWSDRTRKWYISLKDKPGQKRLWTFAGWFITFHFVVLGWVWFALPDFDSAVQVFGKLVGI